MRFLNLREAATTARRDGWCRLTGSIDDVLSAGRREGWSEVPNRRGHPPVSTLRPTSQHDAERQSLSVIHGFGAQPLHTDGAHHRIPPDFVVLVARQPNSVPTLLRRYWSVEGERRILPRHLRNGVFVVRSGKESFYTTAGLDSGVRFDPGCMTPCDQRSRALVQYFADGIATASEFDWDEPELALLIDNRTTLHARADAFRTEDKGRSIDRVSFRVGTQR